MTLAITMIVFASLLAILFAFFVRRLFTRGAESEITLEWLDEFSIETYRPMERLLDEKDYEFLAAQPGFKPAIATELRAKRRQIFRMYLRQLSGDFNKLLRLANLMLVYAPQDRPDLAQAISRLRRQFYFNVACAEIGLALPSLPVPTVDVQGLLQAMETMRRSVRELVPAPQLGYR